MKKSLLLGALAIAALPMMAQDNLVINGDFTGDTSDGGQGQLIPEKWTTGGNVWNSRTTVKDFVAADLEATDPDGLAGDLTKYLCEELYQWNSWENGTCTQAVELGMSSDYTLSYIYRPVVTSVRASANGVNPVKLWVRAYGADEETTAVADLGEPLYDNTIEWNPDDAWIDGVWTAATKEINVGESMYLVIQIGVNGSSGDDSQGGQGENKVSMNVTKIELLEKSGVNDIMSDNVVSKRYFGIDGLEIANPAKGQLVIERATLANGKIATAKRVIR